MKFSASIALLLVPTAISAAASCENLASLSLPHTTITLTEPVAAGEFRPPAFKKLPAFCRVAATLKPTTDSDIKIEVWMPQSGWNGKLQSVGNGAWAGTIGYQALATALGAGYATASTDTGHQGNNADFILGHPEKLIDFGFRSVHEMTVAAKAIVAAYYSSGPKFSYWNGCSTGGRQAMAEVQRFPADYDGVVAGDPVGYSTHIQGAQLWLWQIFHKDQADNIPPEKYALIHNAVLEACDALDGVKDGVLEDPTRCHFDPEVLACKHGDAPTCLTAAQVKTAQRSYAGPMNSRTSQQIYPGRERGSELGWGTHSGPQPSSYAADLYRFIVFKDPAWDYRSFDLDKDVAFADKTASDAMNSIDPNLKRFFERGGKLIQYHGWNDPGVAPQGSVNYYNSVADAMGGAGKIKDSYRLFMVPGMGHCRGGGTDTFDMVTPLDHWVEKGQAPAQIVASRVTNGSVDRTRPLCPYPQVASYKGRGSTDDAQNFSCKAP
jgi:feruloyl esterase